MHAVPPRPSLITHSADFLREALRSGEWEGVLPSERTLCTRMRISRPTLRAVLGQLEREGVIGAVVNKRRQILAAPASVGRAAVSRMIALLTPVPQQAMPPFVLFWVDALRELLAEAGYQMEVHVSPHCFTGKPAGGLKKLTQRVPAAAWVLFRSTPVMQRWFIEQKVPAIIAGSCADGVEIPSVDLDYRATCRHAATMLMQKGHRRIALLLPDSAHGGDAVSAQGFREAFATSDAQACVLPHHETAEQVIESLNGALKRKPAPTAFLVARSIHTLTVVTHLLRLGYKLPGDFAIVSRDDDAFLDHVVPKVTRYSADAAKFAKRLARLVLELAQTGHTSTKPVRLMPDLRRGETA
ncbi:substrate-binding domain-containing protein [Prosthecobacter sp.]|uniref:substrate-binding domain-containing protein n=1 Tax=Prosthecobacter sp. TaxID=1965333 RepID=UPI0037847E5E